MLTLSVIDNGEKSVTFTISGASGTATVKGSRWHSKTGPMIWNDLGTVVAPSGTLTVTLPAFGGWVFIATDGTFCSTVFYQAVIDDAIAIMAQCEEGIAAQIVRLNLDGIGDKVYTQLVPHELVATYPCAFVTSNTGQETTANDSMNSTENIGYPVMVMMAMRHDIFASDPTKGRHRLWKWRQTVHRCFSKQRIPDVRQSIYTTVEAVAPRVQQFNFSGGSNMAGQNSYQLIVTVLTIRCLGREPRGFLQ